MLLGNGLTTVCAPTNTIFDALGSVLEEGLNQVLLHHVIAGANIVSGDLSDGLVSPATLEGEVLAFSIDSAENDGIAIV